MSKLSALWRPHAAVAVLATALLAAAGSAQARSDVYWSVGVNAPGMVIGVGSVPPAVVYATPPVYYAPAPVYYAPPPVVYAPPVWRGHHRKHKHYAPPRGHHYGHGHPGRGHGGHRR